MKIKANSPATGKDGLDKQNTNKGDAALLMFHCFTLIKKTEKSCQKRLARPSPGNHSKAPMRLKFPKCIHTKKALPTIFCSGTKPQ